AHAHAAPGPAARPAPAARPRPARATPVATPPAGARTQRPRSGCPRVRGRAPRTGRPAATPAATVRGRRRPAPARRAGAGPPWPLAPGSAPGTRGTGAADALHLVAAGLELLHDPVPAQRVQRAYHHQGVVPVLAQEAL